MGLSGGDWVVSEKVHGANFSIYYDGEEFKFAKRTSFIGEGKKEDDGTYYTSGGSFYNWQEALEQDEVLKKVDNIFAQLCSRGKDTLVVCGELFGGSYPHKEVDISNVKAVQKGVYYSPQQHFYAFDIKVNGSYIDYFTFDINCRMADLLYAKALMIGSMDDCLQYPNDKQSLVYKWVGLDLPKMEEDNVSEGVVIKPVIPVYFPNGKRVILKNKNEKFAEKSKGKKSKIPQVAKELEPEAKKLLDELLNYITENRLKHVLSHIGDVTDKDFGKILGHFMKDCLDDFMKDFPEYKVQNAANRNMINKSANREAANLIRQNFLNIIDGIF
jgi:Rnl2 family RNA ligase